MERQEGTSEQGVFEMANHEPCFDCFERIHSLELEVEQLGREMAKLKLENKKLRASKEEWYTNSKISNVNIQ